MAYCLLGIFGVNMPLLYGEGERAFVRLQEESMRISDDQSLFAWEITPEHPVYWNGVSCSSGLLAQSPTDFKSCSNISSSEDRWNRTPYSMTNMGLSSKRLSLPSVTYTCLATQYWRLGSQHISVITVCIFLTWGWQQWK
jgi:hypothetical protein